MIDAGQLADALGECGPPLPTSAPVRDKLLRAAVLTIVMARRTGILTADATDAQGAKMLVRALTTWQEENQ